MNSRKELDELNDKIWSIAREYSYINPALIAALLKQISDKIFVKIENLPDAKTIAREAVITAHGFCVEALKKEAENV